MSNNIMIRIIMSVVLTYLCEIWCNLSISYFSEKTVIHLKYKQNEALMHFVEMTFYSKLANENHLKSNLWWCKQIFDFFKY